VDENGYNLRLALELLVYIVKRNGYEFEANDWSWTKTDSTRPS